VFDLDSGILKAIRGLFADVAGVLKGFVADRLRLLLTYFRRTSKLQGVLGNQFDPYRFGCLGTGVCPRSGGSVQFAWLRL
jgi:hypothetical protein